MSNHPAPSDDQQSGTSFLGLWLIVLLVVDVLLGFGLYLTVGAALEFV